MTSSEAGRGLSCCETPDLGPIITGGDGDVIATARRCGNCGVVHMDFLTTASASTPY